MKEEEKTIEPPFNTPIVEEVKQIITEVDATHRYSMSRIYKAYNTIFETNEQPQACASCLIRKVKELRAWLEKETAKEKNSKEAKEVKEIKSKASRRKKSK